MDLTVHTQTYGGSDHSWLGSAHGLDNCDPVELDLSLFDLASDGDFPNGFIPSGVVLGMVTATGKYGPYSDGNDPAGVGVATGHLAFDVHVTVDGVVQATGARPAALFWHGEVDESNLPTNHGLDANAKADLSQIRYV